MAEIRIDGGMEVVEDHAPDQDPDHVEGGLDPDLGLEDPEAGVAVVDVTVGVVIVEVMTEGALSG